MTGDRGGPARAEPEPAAPSWCRVRQKWVKSGSPAAPTPVHCPRNATGDRRPVKQGSHVRAAGGVVLFLPMTERLSGTKRHPVRICHLTDRSSQPLSSADGLTVAKVSKLPWTRRDRNAWDGWKFNRPGVIQAHRNHASKG